MSPKLDSLDHLVLTVSNISEATKFYERALGMSVEKFDAADGTRRTALKFGAQKINLHQSGREFEPKAQYPKPGSADLCFLSSTSVAIWVKHLTNQNISVLEGPINRTGATGPIVSIYIRDPDGNLIEISNHV